MNFYILQVDITKGNGGSISQREPNYPWDAPNAQGELSYHEFPDFEVNFSKLYFERGSIMADFVHAGGSYGGTGYLVSERAKKVLEQFELQEHRFHQLPEYEYKGKTYQYYWMQILIKDKNHSFIDFQQSTFLRADFYKKNGVELLFNTAEELEMALENKPRRETILPEKIVLSDSYQQNPLKLFRLGEIYFPCVVTEAIKTALEEIGVTGAKFVETGICLES